MDGNPRPRYPPNGAGGPGAPSRPSNESRRPPGAPGGPPSTASSSTPSSVSRAERYEDERKRIEQTCFGKPNRDGSTNSYITHVRVLEDAAYPQSPPPPNSNPSSKKPRVIIISLKRTPPPQPNLAEIILLEIHKGRENANGSFSIGKTWDMLLLESVQNYVHIQPRTEEELQWQRWAGDKGFSVVIAKPYYWEAGTPREKDYFVESMLKIYRKYRKGRVFPVLMGFAPATLNELTEGQPYKATPEGRAADIAQLAHEEEERKRLEAGAVQGGGRLPVQTEDMSRDTRDPGRAQDMMSYDRPSLPPQLSQGSLSGRPPGGRAATRRPQPIEAGRGRAIPAALRSGGPSQEFPTGDPRGRPGPGVPLQGQNSPLRKDSPASMQNSPAMMPGPDHPRPLGSRPSMEQSLRQQQSREQIRKPPTREPKPPMPLPGPMPGAFPQQTSQRLTPQSSRSDVAMRPKTPESGSFSTVSASPRRPQADDARSQMSQRSTERPSFEGVGLGIAPSDRSQPPEVPPEIKREPSPRPLQPGIAPSMVSPTFTRSDEIFLDQPPPRSAGRNRPPMSSQQSQRSIASERSEHNTEFHTPTQTPPPPTLPPVSVPPRRKPQEPVKGSDPTTSDNAQNGTKPQTALPLSSQSSQPPPTLPLPQIPNPSESKEAPPAEKEAAAQPATEVESAPPVDVIPSTDEQGEDDATHRPGLGPMVKKLASKGDTAAKLRNAANALKTANAFKPRAGGAAAKLFAKETKPSDEPDGISGVFVPQRPTAKEEAEKKSEQEIVPDAEPIPEPISKEPLAVDTEVVPSVTVSSPLSPTPVVVALSEDKLPSRSPSPDKSSAKAETEAETRRKKRRSNQQVMNISKLGIDAGVLDGRGLEFESLLSEFGWGSSDLSVKNIDSLEVEIKREIARVEAGSWLNHLEQKDERVEAVEKMLDRAIAECDELEGLLTLYNVELSSLNDDVAFIEAQSQGLQVQTANQRLLQNELRQLVDTISITPEQLEALRRAPIGKVNGLSAIESSLVLLYKALITIDPAVIEGRGDDMNKITSSAGFGNSELAAMQALQEKKDRYLNEGVMFLDRLKKHMEITFGAAFLTTRDVLSNVDNSAMPSTKLNIEAHDAGRKMLWMLSPVILFAKEIDRASWDALLRMYQAQAGQIYQDEVRENVLSWKRLARKPTGDEQDLLFTAQEKEAESITGAARKLTVKRSQTLARGLRAASGEKEGKANKAQSGKLHAFDVFSKALDDIEPILLTEQNFVTEFFHATSTDAVDFPEAVSVASPDRRRGPNLWARKQFEADRAMAKRVAEVMEDIFSFWPTELQNLVEWAIKADPLQGVGILYAVGRKLLDMEDSNQDFLMRNLQKVHERLTGLFVRFVDEQIRAIEDTKVKIKKRKGVIAFMKTFPHFSIAIENMLPAADGNDQVEIRRMVDDAYQKINKAMFESLKIIAKESPAVMATQGQGDPEDKEALNYHILLIENMNHYLEEVDARGDSVLLDWKTKASDEMKEHMDLYVDAVIRRPLGKFLEFIESMETLLAQPGASPQSIAQRSSHSRALFKKLLHSYDSKEIRKGIEALKKRVDKHFGDADDPGISRDLVFKVLKECEKKYGEIYDRTLRINQDVYTGEVELDWGPNEVTAAFRR
ncbi:exocyst complex component Sec3-domain-containing protein [Massariosphaeria phaeospora]|uniref:Exocyst complex component Sec3-domain-containing protein n=1 Tax=Massariosphaeria phaeospora TaxID=100035 RepID=A0A7C8IA50_9PLEO|nr:exocyst complex component Sec3-domain-containing protein [Massariosphaeria phaeospora]